MIQIESANYGRSVSESEECPYDRSHEDDVECGNQRRSLRKVAERCNRRSACTVKASNDVFGDPCRGTYKYLEVTYYCIPGRCIN